MKIKDFKLINKGALVARLSIEFPELDLTIRDCIILSGANGQWLKMPSKPFEIDGKKCYYEYVVFAPERKKEVEREVFDKLKDALPKNSHTEFV